MSIPNAQDLQLHLKADVGILLNTGEVETWQDQSSNGNDCTQAVATSRPSPVVDAAGRQGVAFGNSDTEVTFMDIPVGVSVDLANISVFAVGSFYGDPGQPNSLISFDTNDNKGTLGSRSPTSAAPAFLFTSNNSGAVQQSTIVDHSGVAVMGYSSDATSIRFYDQTATSNLAAMTGTGTGGKIGRWNLIRGLRGTIYEILVFNRALTSSESLEVVDYLKRRHGILDITQSIVFEGDSITKGFQSTHNRNYPFYTEMPGFRVHNDAFIGDGWVNIIADGTVLDTNYKIAGLTNTIVAMAGINDILAGGFMAAGTAANAEIWAAARKAAGWDHVGVMTLLAADTSASQETTRLAYNELLRDVAGNSWDFVIDLDDDPVMTTFGLTGNTTYWGNTNHPNSEGYRRVALVIQRQLLDFLYPNTHRGVVTQKAATGGGVYFTIEDLNGNLWDGSSFTQQNMSGWLSHLTVMGEEVADGAKYRGLFPSDVPAGTYKVTVHSRVLSDQPVPTDTAESSRFVQWTGVKLFWEGLPQEIDGITDTSLKEVMLAYIGGMSSVVDNGDGTRTITYKKQDGITSKLVITFNANGEFTETQVA